jgi:hypothetical protein
VDLDSRTVTIAGKAVGKLAGELGSYDDLVESLRQRAAQLGVSYRILEEVAGLAEGCVGKYLSDTRARHFTVDSLLQITGALAVRTVFVEDVEQLRRMQPLYETRNELKVRARRSGPSH